MRDKPEQWSFLHSIIQEKNVRYLRDKPNKPELSKEYLSTQKLIYKTGTSNRDQN